MMHLRKHCFGLFLVGMVLYPVLGFAADAKVGVIDTIQAPLTLKLNARQAVAAALDELGVAMVPLEDMLADDSVCSESDCFLATAKRVGATHLLLVSGVANPAGYRLSLDVRDGSSGRSLGTDGKDCELCAEDQFASTLQERVTKLWKRVAREEARARAASPDRKMGPVVEDKPVAAPAAASPSFWSQRTPVMGLGFAAAGLVGIGFGAYYIAVDGNTVSSSHPTQGASRPIILRDTGKWGWTFAAAGAVALLGGSAMMIWGREDDSNVSVSVGINTVGLQGKF